MSKTFSKSDVASHNKADSLWIVVDDDVYDLTKFQDEHPGMSSLDLFRSFCILTMRPSGALRESICLNQIGLNQNS